MAKRKRVFYCQDCSEVLAETHDAAYFYCPNGHGKILHPSHCVKTCMTSPQRRLEMQAERQRLEKERLGLPICWIEHKHPSLKRRVWAVMGMQGGFALVATGKKEGCLHAYHAESHTHEKIVSLKEMSSDEVLSAIFGKRGVL